MPLERDSRKPAAPLVQASTGAILAVVGLIVLLVVVGVFALSGGDESGKSWSERIASSFSDLIPSASEPAPTAEPSAAAPAPAPEPTEAAPPAAPEPPVERPGSALDRLRDTVERCVPTLSGFAQGVRLIAVDASPDNVDFVQESASVPGRFVRMGCEWGGRDFGLSESGRMVVPARVGDPLRLPPTLIDLSTLTADWYVERVRRAAKLLQIDAAQSPRRVEVAFVGGRGVLARVQFDVDGRVREIVLDAGGRAQNAGAFFPRVERMPDISEEAAAIGYRDQGETIWSSGVAESLQRMQDRYFTPRDRLVSLEFVGRRTTAYLADGQRATRFIIDEYGDKSAAEASPRFPHFCARPFSLKEARAALDDAIRARQETPAQFEKIEFNYAIVDCLDDPQKPRWRFEGS